MFVSLATGAIKIKWKSSNKPNNKKNELNKLSFGQWAASLGRDDPDYYHGHYVMLASRDSSQCMDGSIILIVKESWITSMIIIIHFIARKSVRNANPGFWRARKPGGEDDGEHDRGESCKIT